MEESGRRIAVVLFNLGGPDSPEAIEPFLFNLFSDPSIIGVPQPFRWMLARLISKRRAPIAAKIYQNLGGKSPLLPNTQEQAAALKRALSDLGAVEVFIAMRYWHPMTAAAVAAVKAYDPDEVILLPLYPQFSTTTTASSWQIWQKEAARAKLRVPQKLICCYPTEPGFIGAIARLTETAIAKARTEASLPPEEKPLVIFSAHGLPRKIVEAGDPYVAQVAASVRSVAARLDLGEADWRMAFQSRVGPLEWVAPSTDDAVAAAARDNRAIVMVPVAFVSEHSETLVELDIEYRHLAKIYGAKAYVRAPTVQAGADFIVGLSRLVRQAINHPETVQDGMGRQFCDAWEKCACKIEERRTAKSSARSPAKT